MTKNIKRQLKALALTSPWFLFYAVGLGFTAILGQLTIIFMPTMAFFMLISFHENFNEMMKVVKDDEKRIELQN